MILRIFVLKSFKDLTRRRFVLYFKFFFEKSYSLKGETLKINFFENDLIKSFKEIIEIDFSNFN